jgi:N-acetylmuramoyl-L-alanine amidase
VLEKDLNLAVALKLRSLISQLDVNVIMTRETDVMLADEASAHKKRDDLNARLNMAKEQENCIFVSIHMNKFPQPQYSGLQVYYSANAPQSRTVAGVIRNYTKQYLQPQNEREIKAATSSIYLLHRCDIPAVMVECGFLSNEEELSRLKDETYRRQLALVIACAAAESLSGVKQ